MRYYLISEHVRRNACAAIMEAPDGFVATINKPKRREIQSAKFHAICGDLERQAEHMGRRFDKDQWKHLLVSAHAIETKQPFEPIMGLAGEFLNVRESTAKMTTARMASLIEYALSVAAEKGVRLSADAMA